MREYNVHEVLAILKEYYITDSQLMVTRWIRQGKLYAVRSANRKDVYLVSEEDLFDFIEELRPGLPQVLYIYKDYIENLTTNQDTKSTESYRGDIIHKEEVNPKEEETELEEMVQQLLEEQSLLNQRMVEVIAQNQDLIEEN